MSEVRVRAPNPAPAVGETVTILVEVDPAGVAVPTDGIAITLRYGGAASVTPDVVLRFTSGAREVQSLRLTLDTPGNVRIRARSESLQPRIRIPRLRDTGQVEEPDPIVLSAEESFRVRAVVPSRRGTCVPTDTTAPITPMPDIFRNWRRTDEKAVVLIPLGTRVGTMADRVAQVVAAVQFAERNFEGTRGRPGTRGSGWSFTDCVVDRRTNLVFDTDGLGSERTEVLTSALARAVPAARLLHVEAGIKLDRLNCLLDSRDLAMPTLGGSRGQSIAGAMSTGVHGGDIDRPPVADAVRAIHLVGSGGQEWWIEPHSDRITDPLRMAQLREDGVFCRNLRIEYSDDLFNAVLVSMGCSGVIYSVVLEARSAFHLHTRRSGATWLEAQRLIASIADGSAREDYVDINVGTSDRDCRVTRRTETRSPLRGPRAPVPNLGEIAASVGMIGPGAMVELSAEVARIITQLVGLIPRLLILDPFAVAELATLGISPGSFDPTLANLRRFLELLNELGASATNPSDAEQVARVLPRAINYAWTLGSVARSGRALVDALQRQVTRDTLPDEDSIQTSYGARTGQDKCSATVTGHPQDHSATDRLVESFEYVVPIGATISFVDGVLALIDELRNGIDALVVNVNLRFTRATRALLGMQQFERNCHVEIYTFRGVAGNAAFHARLEAMARRFAPAAIPHWGQLHQPDYDFPRLYGEKLTIWRWAMSYLASSGDGVDGLFWNDFARQRQLFGIAEPQSEAVGLRGLRAVRDGSGRIQLFGIGLGNGLWLVRQRAAGDHFVAWQRVRGAVSQLALAPAAEGPAQLFAVSGPSVHHASRRGDHEGETSVWQAAVRATQQLAASRNQDGRLVLFGLTREGELELVEVNARGSWGSWSRLGNSLLRFAVGQNEDGRLEVFGIGTDAALHHIYQTTPNGAWSGWESLGGTLDSLAVGRNHDGRLQVFAVARDKTLQTLHQRRPNSGWGNWTSLGGEIRRLAVASNEDGRLEVFAAVDANRIEHLYQLTPNGRWSEWSPLGTISAVRELVAERNQDGRLEVFTISGNDNSVHRIAQTAPNSGWGEWTGLGLPVR